MKKLFLLLTILGVSFKALSQGLIGTPESLIIVYNFPNNSFYVEIKGTDKRTTDQPTVYIIDNKIVQVLALPIEKFTDVDPNNSTDIEILKSYINWESDYLKSTFQFDIINNIELLQTKKGNSSIFWTYDMPVSSPEIKSDSSSTEQTQKQMFILRLIKNCVVGICTPLFNKDDFESNKLFLYYNIDGIHESKKEIDIEELNQKVNKKQQ